MSRIVNQDAVVSLISRAIREDIVRAQDAVILHAQEDLRKRLQGIVSKAALLVASEYSIERMGSVIRIEVKTDG